jgi:hypothetical protein
MYSLFQSRSASLNLTASVLLPPLWLQLPSLLLRYQSTLSLLCFPLRHNVRCRGIPSLALTPFSVGLSSFRPFSIPCCLECYKEFRNHVALHSSLPGSRAATYCKRKWEIKHCFIRSTTGFFQLHRRVFPRNRGDSRSNCADGILPTIGIKRACTWFGAMALLCVLDARESLVDTCACDTSGEHHSESLHVPTASPSSIEVNVNATSTVHACIHYVSFVATKGQATVSS